MYPSDINQILTLAAIAILTFAISRWLPIGHPRSAREPVHADRQPRTNHHSLNGRTFRMRGVPLEWDAARVLSFLTEHYGSAKPVIKSLAPEIGGRFRTGTVVFLDAVSPPDALQTGSPWRISLPRRETDQATCDESLMLDDDFHGITTLFAPPPDDHKVDIVALSGLGGHAFGSFKERKGTHMWLRDSLPYDLTRENTGRPMARVMTYGYESSVVQSKNIQNLEDLATSLHNSLLALVGTPTIKPLILVAHSLGGLIVKQVSTTGYSPGTDSNARGRQ
ncbi:hypothetical protein B0T25DRAFT_214835 [Lasiosphaeria hispida]|uniref:Uncharacterized protein n=1 Tax=Lasiosphaeria hispida TaxID=260671 RepID=A0AAJ0MEU5_9PEZI|nr:hypothetical protein B0T25DRAFT_214835 [Lasiosphaeria hispida]